MSIVCSLCFHHCRLEDGQTGFCRARANHNGTIVSLNYGRLTALALDPIEKKPLRRFHPGSMVLSVGSFGCNLRCPFCQNASIAQVGAEAPTRTVSPNALVQLAHTLQNRGNIGIAYTYNEPLGGDLTTVKQAITIAAALTHVEVTTLIIPDENDSHEEIDALAAWLASVNPEIPLHVSRFFPRHHMTRRAPTPVDTVYHLADVAREHLRYVYTGNC